MLCYLPAFTSLKENEAKMLFLNQKNISKQWNNRKNKQRHDVHIFGQIGFHGLSFCQSAGLTKSFRTQANLRRAETAEMDLPSSLHILAILRSANLQWLSKENLLSQKGFFRFLMHCSLAATMTMKRRGVSILESGSSQRLKSFKGYAMKWIELQTQNRNVAQNSNKSRSWPHKGISNSWPQSGK